MNITNHTLQLPSLWLTALLLTALPLAAQSPSPSPAPEASTSAPTVVNIIGKAENIPTIAGSAALVDQQQIQRQTYTNPNRVLLQVPGVYVREEDGFGNFPNISLRGADGGRSSKATIMEDGIMMAPAPYSSPGAYYFPRLGRMSGVEVLKGSSQVRFGPQTTGGVVNFLSTPFVALPEPPPAEQPEPGAKNPKAPVAPVNAQDHLLASEFYLKSTFGSFNTWTNHAWWGHTQDFDAGTFGMVLEMFHNQSDGFREIDKVGGNTGFTVLDPNIKLFFEPATEMKQRFELRAGFSSLDADETYLGLKDSDLAADPLRRYVSTQFDNITSEQHRISLSHSIDFSEKVRLETTAYYTRFARNWYKLDAAKDAEGEKFSLASALAGGNGLDVLRGNAPGSWVVRANDREYYTMGVQTRLDWDFMTGSVEHELTVGARIHYDEASRFQFDDTFRVNGTGSVLSRSRGRPGTAGNREESVTAFSSYVEDSIKLGRLTLKPGVRWEHLNLEYTDFDDSGANPSRVKDSGSDTLDLVTPGMGLVYSMTDTWSLFGGYYQGISTPEPRQRIREGTRAEKSQGYELGLRHFGKAVQAEIAGFYTNFDDLLVRDSLGGAGNASDESVGGAKVYGVEAAIRWDSLSGTNSEWRLPLRASATLTQSEITTDTGSGEAESIFSGARKGNQLPYVPEIVASVGFGVERGPFALHMDATYSGDMYGTGSNTSSLRDPDGKPDARFGKTDDAILVDLSLSYQLNENIRFVAGISNLLGEEYVVSRLPYGARSNQPRTYFGGVELRF